MLKVALVWSGFLGLALLNACTHQAGAPGKPAWNFYTDDAEAKLAYGRPNSDDVGLMLSCRPHSGSVLVSGAIDPSSAAHTLTLASGPATSALSGAAEPDPESGATLLQAQASLRDDALANFARTGRLSVIQPDRALVIPATDADRGAIRRFFARCA